MQKIEIAPTMNAHEFINEELEFDLNNPYIPIEEEIIHTLDKRDDAVDNEPIEEVDNVQIGDMVVDRVGFKDVESALMTLIHFLEQRLLMLHLSSKAFKHFKGNRTLACTRTLSNYSKFILPLWLRCMTTLISYVFPSFLI
jgi:hypothetical protein